MHEVNAYRFKGSQFLQKLGRKSTYVCLIIFIPYIHHSVSREHLRPDEEKSMEILTSNEAYLLIYLQWLFTIIFTLHLFEGEPSLH